jgi:hypothetical protein
VLVDLLDEDYAEQAELVEHALNGIGSVFELQSPTTKNDFCRMFIREGLLDPLSAALLNVIAAHEHSQAELQLKIIHILVVFCQVSQSDIHVRNALGTRKVVRREFLCTISSFIEAENQNRLTPSMRAARAEVLGTDAQGYQASLDECNTARGPAEC